jgi:regulation of enolase protein 1 (concanavalin A-like superfamily)
MKKYYREDFYHVNQSPKLHWFNEPQKWDVQSGKLVIFPSKTDFWSRTHYGFVYDNGHFLYHQIPGNFIISTKVSFFPQHQYDQAGLMVRVNGDFWLKTSVEHENTGLNRLGVVATNFGFSDWSTQDFDPDIQEIELKVEKDGMDYLVYYKNEHQNWSQLRISHIHKENSCIQCGIYACCPIKTGFRAEFEYLDIQYKNR